MKLNNKGFAISSIMYIILVLAVILIAVTLALLSSRKLVLDKLKKETLDDIYGISYNSVVNKLKQEAISYASINNKTQENIKIGDFETSISQELLEYHKLSDKYLTLYKNEDNYDVYLGKTKKVTDISKPIENMLGIVDYKISGNSVQGKLPSDYQQVEYIESTGTQYIATGFLATDNVKIKGKVYTSTQGNEMCVVGTKEGGFEIGYSALTNRFFIYSSGFTTPITTTSSLYDTTLDFTATITTQPSTELILHNIDGGLTATGTDTNELDDHSEIQLFRYKESYYFVGRIYELKVYDNDKMTRNFIPCYRKSDNVIGMYDLVNDVFYTNQGTGAFLKGANMPTPEVPIEIENIGEKTKNILKYPYTESTKNSLGVTFTDNGDGSVTVEGTSTSFSTLYLSNNEIKLEAGKKYYLKADGTYSGVHLIFAYKDSEGNRRYDGNGLEWKNEYSAPIMYLQVNTDETASGTLFPYLVEEEYKNLNYEPYGYKIPVKASGKNLFDISRETNSTSGEIVEKGENYVVAQMKSSATNSNPGSTFWSSGWLSYDIELPTSKTYTVSYDVELLENTTGLTELKSMFLLSTESDTTISQKVYTISEVNKKYHIEATFNNLEDKEVGELVISLNSCKWRISNLQIEEGATATSYEPYVEPITTNIYVDEPLRKIGDYVDYIDFENSRVVRKIYHEYLTGITAKSSVQGTYSIFLTDILATPVIVLNEGNSFGYAMSNKFKQSDVNYLNMVHKPNMIQAYITSAGVNRVAFTFDDSSINTIPLAQEKIGDGFEVNYVLQTSIEEELELPNIAINDGATILEVDGNIKPSNVELTIIEKIKKL